MAHGALDALGGLVSANEADDLPLVLLLGNARAGHVLAVPALHALRLVLAPGLQGARHRLVHLRPGKVQRGYWLRDRDGVRLSLAVYLRKSTHTKRSGCASCRPHLPEGTSPCRRHVKGVEALVAVLHGRRGGLRGMGHRVEVRRGLLPGSADGGTAGMLPRLTWGPPLVGVAPSPPFWSGRSSSSWAAMSTSSLSICSRCPSCVRSDEVPSEVANQWRGRRLPLSRGTRRRSPPRSRAGSRPSAARQRPWPWP